MHDEAFYNIRVAGRLGAEWSGRLADMRLVVHEGPARATTTVLTGPVEDQAALMGVLNQLYELGATILSVDRREFADSRQNATGTAATQATKGD